MRKTLLITALALAIGFVSAPVMASGGNHYGPSVSGAAVVGGSGSVSSRVNASARVRGNGTSLAGANAGQKVILRGGANVYGARRGVVSTASIVGKTSGYTNTLAITTGRHGVADASARSNGRVWVRGRVNAESRRNFAGGHGKGDARSGGRSVSWSEGNASNESGTENWSGVSVDLTAKANRNRVKFAENVDSWVGVTSYRDNIVGGGPHSAAGGMARARGEAGARAHGDVNLRNRDRYPSRHHHHGTIPGFRGTES